jgi:ankyrin repeat protein
MSCLHIHISNNLENSLVPVRPWVDSPKSDTSVHPFLHYAIKNMLYHANAAARDGIAQGSFLDDFPLQQWAKLDGRHTESVSLQYVLAAPDMGHLIKSNSNFRSYLEVENERNGPPLFAAIASGGKEAAQACFEGLRARRRIESCPCVRDGRFSKFGLECHGMKSSPFVYSKERDIVSCAVELGNLRVLAVLIDSSDFDVDLPDPHGRTPLWWATRNGCEASVKMLLDAKKVGVNSKDTDGQTPLHIAAARGYCGVVNLLLSAEAIDVDNRDNYGQTPLLRAAQLGPEAAVKLLLETGEVDINSEDGRKRTPLSWAAGFGYVAVVKLLLETGKANVYQEDSIRQTPLSRATDRGYGAIVEQLHSYRRSP